MSKAPSVQNSSHNSPTKSVRKSNGREQSPSVTNNKTNNSNGPNTNFTTTANGSGQSRASTAAAAAAAVSSLLIVRTPYTLADALSEAKVPTRIKHCELAFSSEQLQANLTLQSLTFYRTDDHPFNKRGYKYKSARPNPLFPSLLYGTSDLPPYAARLSYFDRSPGTAVDEEVAAVTADSGWRSARCNVGVYEGRWYFEYHILNANDSRDKVHGSPHVRIGLGRREASLEAPIGYDAYGYALRDTTGQTVHLSRPRRFMDRGFQTGDVVGFLVELPDMDVQRRVARSQIKHKTPGEPSDAERYFGPLEKPKEEAETAGNTVPVAKKRKKSKKMGDNEREQIGDIDDLKFGDVSRDQIPIKYKNETYYEQFEYCATGPFEHLLNPVTVFGEKAVRDSKPFTPAALPESRITVFKNGRHMGTAFEDLYAFLPPSSKLSKSQFFAKQYNNDGSLGYYPMASVFKKGVVKLNPGPDFAFVPEELEEQLRSHEVRSFSERYEEAVAEDVVYDVIDEIECEFLEGRL